MTQFRSGAPGRVWRLMATALHGEYVDVDAPRAPAPPPKDLQEAAGWVSSSFDLASGLEIVETDDAALANFIGELFKRPAE